MSKIVKVCLAVFIAAGIFVNVAIAAAPVFPQEARPAPILGPEIPAIVRRALALLGTRGGECVYFVQQFTGRLKNCDRVDCEAKKFRGYAGDIEPNSDMPHVGSAVLMDYKMAHAAVIVGIGSEEMSIVESNFGLDGKVSTRRIRKDDPHIRGYYDFRPDDIDEYFAARHMPLAGSGAVMVAAADENGIDWRLLPAIAVQESTGGKKACGPNPFGWASCRRTFSSIEEAIATVARHLGGNATSTRRYYADRTTAQKLEVYNPRSIAPDYPEEVAAIMAEIDQAGIASK